MSLKNNDQHGRWRNITVAFRISPEEDKSLKMRVRLSGLTKQDYICSRCLEQDIVVKGTPRVYKALKDEMAAILSELRRIDDSSQISDIMTETIRIVAATLDGMKS